MPASKERQERLARALRQNLKRRKARGRALKRGTGKDVPADTQTASRNPAQNGN